MKWVAACLALLPQTATALSCLRPDVVRSYEQARDAELSYAVVLGRFSALPVDGEMVVEPLLPAPVDFRFDGVALSADGFDLAVSLDVMVQITCSGPWCGHVPGTDETLAFIARENDTYVLHEAACPSWSFRTPSDDDLNRLVLCHQGIACDQQ